MIRAVVDLQRVARSAAAIRERVGKSIFVYGVVKADGYGLGARDVARAMAESVDGYYCFSLREAVEAGLGSLGRRIIALDQPVFGWTADDYRSARVTPIVSGAARCAFFAGLRPVLSIDTGMHRFGCPAEEARDIVRKGDVGEVMTHGVRGEQVARLLEVLGDSRRALRVHAAGTKLLEEGEAYWLDGVRPGLALYRGALWGAARVIEARDVPVEGDGSAGRAGYGQFEASRVGVIYGGYSAGVRAGVCLVRGERRRVLEAGMQSCYVELRPGEGVGEEVVLLGDGLTEAEVAEGWSGGGKGKMSEQEVLVRMGQNREGSGWVGQKVQDFGGSLMGRGGSKSAGMMPRVSGSSSEGLPTGGGASEGGQKSGEIGDLRKLRHDVRGCMHGLQLVISALETPLTPADAAEFLGDVERAAERMDGLIAKLEGMPEP